MGKTDWGTRLVQRLSADLEPLPAEQRHGKILGERDRRHLHLYLQQLGRLEYKFAKRTAIRPKLPNLKFQCVLFKNFQRYAVESGGEYESQPKPENKGGQSSDPQLHRQCLEHLSFQKFRDEYFEKLQL